MTPCKTLRRWSLCAALALPTLACDPQAEPDALLEVELGELVVDVDVSGTLESVASLSVGPPTIPGVYNYKIAMMAEEGGAVEEGAPILMFDTSDLQRRFEAKTAERDSAATQLKMLQAAAKIEREDERLAIVEAKAAHKKAKLKADVPTELLSSIELDQSRLDLKLARRKVTYLTESARSAGASDQAEIGRWRNKRDRAEQRVTQITSSIESMKVKAVRAGTVIHHTDWRGDKKKVGDSLWRGQTAMQIVSLSEMEGRGEIDEVDVSRVQVSQEVSLRLDAQPDVELRGKIKTIAQTVQRASPDNPLKVAVVQVELGDHPGVKVRPGMRFQGRIETDRETDVLLVPLAALEFTPEGTIAHRWHNGTAEPVVVTLGRRNDTLAIVEEGLDAGDELVPVAEVHR